MAKTELMKKILKNSKSAYADAVMETELLNRDTLISTPIPALNIALSGEINGGFAAGVTTIAGKSKHFKTMFALEMAKGFLKTDPEAVLVFFDSEFGSPREYFKSFGEDVDRILHIPITDVESLRTELMNQLEALERSDKVMFIIDSIGNLASVKETEDALSGKQAVDMTRAKMLKSLFRVVTPRLVMKNIPMVCINHTYDTIEMFSKQVMTGGTGNVYASDTIIFVGKQQEKDGADLLGWNFILNIEKSRFVREKEKIGVLVTYAGGVNKYSGMFDLACELGLILSPTKGYYQIENDEKKYRRKELEDNVEYMESLLNDVKFCQLVESRFKL